MLFAFWGKQSHPGCFGPCEQHGDPVDPQRNAHMRRCPILQGFDKKSKTFFDLLRGHLEQREDFGLQIAVKNSFGTRPELVTVQHKVVA